MTPIRPALALPEIAFFGRSFSEYLLFFDLRPAQLAGRRVLDCAAGPSDFAAEAAARGADVVALDPLYDRSESALRRLAGAAFARMLASMRAAPELFSTHTFSSIDSASADRRAAQERFLADYHAGVPVGRYRHGALPALPFGDRAFDFVTCSHLLFVYDHLLDLDFHVAALREMCRVSAGEVRIHPVVDRTGELSPLLAPAREALAHLGVRTALREVDYEFFRGTRRTLVLNPSP